MGSWRALPCLALLAAAAGAGPEEDAKRLWSEYQKIRTAEGWKAFDRRLDILRALGGCDCEGARKTLLQLVRTSRSGDERLLSILSLGRILDLETAKDLLRLVERKPEPAIVQALADAFAGAKHPDVVAWLGGGALDTKQPDVLRACLEALAVLKPPEAAAKVLAIHGSLKDPVLLHEAVRALGGTGGPGARTALLSAASHPDFRVRLAAAGALPGCASGDEQILAAVRALLLDAEPVVRRAAIAAARDAMLEAVVPDLAELLEKRGCARARPCVSRSGSSATATSATTRRRGGSGCGRATRPVPRAPPGRSPSRSTTASPSTPTASSSSWTSRGR